ncbi:hypothetical protein [uncultured Ruegeria sp.]|uniref:hypothetical protein n=1 Tax=uncultured Ruegeria sp. TaxID=259304 RepID=UPI002616B85A|nr:hypothetical protein [uncultured Ruegeria sp.]
MLVGLCGVLVVRQASRFDGLSFSHFPWFQNGVAPPEVDISECDVAEAFVIALMAVVIDKGWDLGCKFAG